MVYQRDLEHLLARFHRTSEERSFFCPGLLGDMNDDDTHCQSGSALDCVVVGWEVPKV